MRVELVELEVGDAVLGPPLGDDVLRRPAVEAAVDLRAAADAAALRVGDGGEAERGRHAAGAVLAVHLGERERGDLALLDVRALLGDEHVETGLGEQRCGRRSAGARADDEHLGVELRASPLPDHRRRVWPRVPDVGVGERADQPDVLAEEG